MFFGRDQELAKLEKRYTSQSFEMVIIYGRRRVGKTTLINEFCKNKKAIIFSAFESTSSANLSSLSAAVFACTMPEVSATPEFKGFAEALDYIAEIAKNERMIWVIDEYPYLASSEKSISSLLQNAIDQKFIKSKLFIIICGSSMSFMENQVLGYQSPLYGRRTAQFKILPFDYFDAAKWIPNYSDQDKAIVYGVTGGVPLYLEKFSESVPIQENIMECIFDQNAFLFEEPSNLLKQELREPQTYNAIIAAIATGNSRLNEIAAEVHIANSTCVIYINNLIALGIIKKETPVTEKAGRKTIYIITDNLFRFWYRFVPANMAAIASGRIRETYHQSIEPFISDYMGLVFEQMCKDYLLFRGRDLPVSIGEIGQWWGNNPNKKQQSQIDIILVSADKKAALFGECKFRNELVDTSTLDQLIEESSVFSEFKEKHYCLFSKTGFTERLKSRANQESIMLIDLKNMYHGNV
jgi:AAA+ ATPase superfamily predicted ATPase